MSDNVRDFYNQFTKDRMVNYHTTPNLRVQKAVDFVLQHTRHNDTVLELGCGVGVCTKALAHVVTQGALWAFDISDDAIAVARQYVSTGPYVHITQADILKVSDELFEPSGIGAGFSVITLCDTLEHLPAAAHLALFRFLADVAQTPATMLLTLPSPSYQMYLQEHNPAELQIIDQVITSEHLEVLADAWGGELVSYQHVDCWRPRQYVHARLVR